MASGGRVGFVWQGLTMASFGSAGRIGFVLQRCVAGDAGRLAAALGSFGRGWRWLRSAAPDGLALFCKRRGKADWVR